MKLFNHKTLYCRDVSGRVRVWWMAHLEGEGKYCTFSGLLDGEKVQSEFTQAEGKNIGKKNETSADKQALKEIEAKYKKQLKTGYFESIDEIDNALRGPVPMLAKSYKDYKEKVDANISEWFVQCKLNGFRCLAKKDGLYTRTGERYVSVPHIEEALAEFFEKNPEAVLDGELFNNEYRQKLSVISELLRKTTHITPEDLDLSKKFIKFYIYDGYKNQQDKSNSYEDRIGWINSIAGIIQYTMPVTTYYIFSTEQLNKIYLKYVSDGQEGVMLRYKKSSYEEKRSKYLLKYKPLDDAEGKVIAIHEGTGNWAGIAKSATIEWDGKVFDATFKGDQEVLRDLLRHPEKIINQSRTFIYNGLTTYGIPNYARIDIDNCIKK